MQRLHTRPDVVRAVTIMVHQFDETFQWLQKQAQLLSFGPKGSIDGDGGDLVGFPVAFVSKRSRGTHFSENGMQENETLDDIVNASKASLPVENDDICFSMKSKSSKLDLGAGVGVVAEKLRQLDAGVDYLRGPSMCTDILEKKVPTMRGATYGHYHWV